MQIPISVNLDDYKKKMNESAAVARTATKAVLNEFVKMNAEIGGPIAATLAANVGKSILGVAGKVALLVGTMKLVGDAIGAVRNQLSEMVTVADKATETGLSPEFWQSFVAGAKGGEKQIELFQGALENAYQALKPVLNPDWTVWNDGLKKVSAIEDAMRGMRELFTTDQDFSGFDLFRNAQNQDQKIAAVLTYMKQLQNIGQDVAALDLGDKLFGSRFTDQIRRGTLSVDQMLDDIKTKSVDIFSNDNVTWAKQLDTELKNAWRTVDQNLHPSLESLDTVGLAIKSVWVDIVDLIAKASKLLNPDLGGENAAAAALAATGEIGAFGFQPSGEAAPQRVVITGDGPAPTRKAMSA